MGRNALLWVSFVLLDAPFVRALVLEQRCHCSLASVPSRSIFAIVIAHRNPSHPISSLHDAAAEECSQAQGLPRWSRGDRQNSLGPPLLDPANTTIPLTRQQEQKKHSFLIDTSGGLVIVDLVDTCGTEQAGQLRNDN